MLCYVMLCLKEERSTLRRYNDEKSHLIDRFFSNFYLNFIFLFSSTVFVYCSLRVESTLLQQIVAKVKLSSPDDTKITFFWFRQVAKSQQHGAKSSKDRLVHIGACADLRSRSLQHQMRC